MVNGRCVKVEDGCAMQRYLKLRDEGEREVGVD